MEVGNNLYHTRFPLTQKLQLNQKKSIYCSLQKTPYQLIDCYKNYSKMKKIERVPARQSMTTNYQILVSQRSVAYKLQRVCNHTLQGFRQLKATYINYNKFK